MYLRGRNIALPATLLALAVLVAALPWARA